MFATAFAAVAVSLRVLVFSAIFMAPVAGLAYNNGSGMLVEKQGAGLVLYVSLQRQSMN
jgi:hypothetical protein